MAGNAKKKLMGNIHSHDQYLTIIVGNLGLVKWMIALLKLVI